MQRRDEARCSPSVSPRAGGFGQSPSEGAPRRVGRGRPQLAPVQPLTILGHRSRTVRSPWAIASAPERPRSLRESSSREGHFHGCAVIEDEHTLLRAPHRITPDFEDREMGLVWRRHLRVNGSRHFATARAWPPPVAHPAPPPTRRTAPRPSGARRGAAASGSTVGSSLIAIRLVRLLAIWWRRPRRSTAWLPCPDDFEFRDRWRPKRAPSGSAGSLRAPPSPAPGP